MEQSTTSIPRGVIRQVAGRPVVDGAGVRLMRVLGVQTVKNFDPFLMLDAFDSRNAKDYIAGFPIQDAAGQG